jgi:hypothetical protein
LNLRGYVRFGVLAASLVGALSTGASCYRAELDLAPLGDDQPPAGGGGVTVGAGEAGMSGGGDATGGKADGGGSGGASGGADAGGIGGVSGGAAGAPTCDPTPEDAVQHQCLLRKPSKQMCDVQAADGWNGCYDGGCSICTKVLIDYPYYLERHRCCEENTTCSKHEPYRCSPWCPPPTELDKRPVCFDLEH